jgi:hypothetical protein
MAWHGAAWHWHGTAWHWHWHWHWHVMARHGTAWHGTAWHGMAWQSMAWHSMARSQSLNRRVPAELHAAQAQCLHTTCRMLHAAEHGALLMAAMS